MPEAPYSNREIKAMIQVFDAKLDSYKAIQNDILAQVKYTNGRVRWNEKMIYMALGALAIIAPVLAWYMADYLHFKENYQSNLSTSIQSALDGYEFEITP